MDIQQKRIFMRVSKWGNSLVVRLPAAEIQALGLKEGDEIEITIVRKLSVEVASDQRREEALESIRHLARPLPADFRFDREEANKR